MKCFSVGGHGFGQKLQTREKAKWGERAIVDARRPFAHELTAPGSAAPGEGSNLLAGKNSHTHADPWDKTFAGYKDSLTWAF